MENLYIHQYRGIVCTEIGSDGLYVRPNDSNTLTRQSEDAPRDPFQTPITWNPDHGPYLCLCLRLCMNYWATSWSPQSIRHFFNRSPISTSFIRRKRYLRNFQFCAAHRFQFDSTHWSWLDLTQHFRLVLNHHLRLDLNHQFQLDSTHQFWFDLTHWFWLDFTHRFRLGMNHGYLLDLAHIFDSIQIMFNTFIFDSSQIIQVPFNLGFMEYYIGQGVFEIIQHWNCRIFHNYEN